LGIALSQTLCRLLLWSVSPEGQPVELRIVTDWRVLLYASAAAVLSCVIFGALPALRASNSSPATAMKAGGRGMTAGRERFSLQRAMVIAQISVSLLLLVGALLFVRSFRNLLLFSPGMRESGITSAFLGYWQSNQPPDRWMAFERELLTEIQNTPGVLSAATTTNVPLSGGSWQHGIHAGDKEGLSKFTWVSPDYFATMGIPVIRGRGLTQNDTSTSQRVAVVNEMLARRMFNGADPIGKTLRTAPEPNYPSTIYEVVGVIPDTKYDDIQGEMPPQTLAPASQFPAQGPWASVMIRSNLPPDALIAVIKRKLARNHPDVVTEFRDFQRGIRDGLMAERMMATVSGFFGLLAALLAMVGLYGVISFLVARRRNEIGIRLALGAERGQVVAMVMREAARLLAIGVVTGVALSLLAGRGAGSLLFGLRPYDPLTLVTAALLLALIAAVASFLPARRASKLNPMVALRDE